MAGHQAPEEGEEDRSQEQRQKKEPVCQRIRQLGQAKEPRRYDQHKERGYHIDKEIAERLPQEHTHHASVVPVDEEEGRRQASPLPLCPRDHRYADEECLLDDQHQDSRQEEALEAALRIEGGYPFAFDRAHGDACRPLRSSVMPSTLDLTSHSQGHFRSRQDVRLVVHRRREGRMQVDMRLLIAIDLTAEVLGDHHDPVGTFFCYEAVGFGFVRYLCYDKDVGGSIDTADIFP